MSSPHRKARRRYPTLLAWREAQGYNLQQAADSLGLPLTSYWNYERGTKLPKRPTLRSIYEQTGVAVEFLAGVA